MMPLTSYTSLSHPMHRLWLGRQPTALMPSAGLRRETLRALVAVLPHALLAGKQTAHVPARGACLFLRPVPSQLMELVGGSELGRAADPCGIHNQCGTDWCVWGSSSNNRAAA
jgi:hypothetical protein